jgi:excisionase family DNA binding protein
MDSPAPKFYTVAEVAALMRVSGMTIYRLVRSGELRALRVGHSYRVPAEALDAYLSDGQHWLHEDRAQEA